MFYIPRRRSSSCLEVSLSASVLTLKLTHDHVSLFCYCIISLCMDGINDTSPSVVANLVDG